MINRLALLSKTDIPFQQAQLIIHQPTISEISYIGEQAFFTGCEYLNFSKKNLSEQDKIRLSGFNDFEILMTIMKNKDIAIEKAKTSMLLVLSLMFPDYKINFLPQSILLMKTIDGKPENHIIDKDNFESFKNIVSQMFCLTDTLGSQQKYNPGGPQAMALVKKFEQRQRRLAKLKNQQQQQNGLSILSQYVSILAVGQKKDMNLLVQYSVYQLFDQFRRFQLKENFDIYVEAKMAGAKDLEDVTNWMGDIHSDNF